MPAHPIVAEVATLAVADPATCDRAQIAELVARSLAVRGWLDSFDGRLAIRSAQEAADGSSDPAAAVLAGAGRRSGRDAKAVVARGEICQQMPELHDALAAATVSAGHVDAIARAASDLDESGRADLAALAEPLIEAAARSSVEAFERQVRDLARRLSRDDGVGQHERMRRQRSLRRWLDNQTGLTHTHVILDPESDARFSEALDAAVAAEQAKPDPEDRTWEQLRADAFVALVSGAGGNGVPGGVAALIDHDTLCHGLHDRSVCETGDGQPLPPETIRRMACDAEIIPIVLDGRGAVLDQGMGKRVATAAQRVALRAMYRSCGHPGCTVRFDDCQIHHVIEWVAHHGPTNLDNLLPLCSQHHHLVHEGGWQLTLSPDRTITLTRPDGTVAYHGTSITVAPHGVAAETTEPAGEPVAGQPVDPATAALQTALAAVESRFRAFGRTHRSTG